VNLARHPSGLLLPAADERAIEDELQRLDPRLYLSFEIEGGRQVYRVMCEYAGDRFAPVCDWRDEQQRPLPLSSGLVELVRSLQPRGGVAAQEAMAANERRRERLEADVEEAVDEIADDMGPRIAGRKQSLLNRSPGLVASRRRARRRGENV